MADAADDPAIFSRADGSSFAFGDKNVSGVILGTDKKAGLYVFDLDGTGLQFLPDGLLNNVDLREDGNGFVAVASDRGRMGVAVYRWAGSGKLEPAGFVKSDLGEPYGMCLGRIDGQLVAALIGKDGQVRQYALTDTGGTFTGTEQRRFAIGSQSEGCSIDDATGALYIGEEMVGLWRYAMRGEPTRTLIAGATGPELVHDVEGVTILNDGAERYLLVSSQGDSAFAVWRIDGDAPAYKGRFRVAAANGADEVTGTDGIDARGGKVGRFGQGLVVVQDDVNDGAPQNFKLVDWAAIKAALAQ